MKTILLILFSISTAIAGQIFLKVGMDRIGRVEAGALFSSLVRMASSPIIITGLFCYATSAVVWMIVLSHVPLSYAYPFLGLTYVAMLFITKYAFNESIPPWRWAGTLLIFIGVLASAIDSPGANRSLASFLHLFYRK